MRGWLATTHQAGEQDVCDKGELAVLLGGDEARERSDQLELLPRAHLLFGSIVVLYACQVHRKMRTW